LYVVLLIFYHMIHYFIRIITSYIHCIHCLGWTTALHLSSRSKPRCVKFALNHRGGPIDNFKPHLITIQTSVPIAIFFYHRCNTLVCIVAIFATQFIQQPTRDLLRLSGQPCSWYLPTLIINASLLTGSRQEMKKNKAARTHSKRILYKQITPNFRLLCFKNRVNLCRPAGSREKLPS